ncbi:hypothetical protein H0H92_005455 [Tricholoma furcatifolium]|nr:hypothetical protein H0H92_005455 [Tricholoma furcatifolium]
MMRVQRAPRPQQQPPLALDTTAKDWQASESDDTPIDIMILKEGANLDVFLTKAKGGPYEKMNGPITALAAY